MIKVHSNVILFQLRSLKLTFSSLSNAFQPISYQSYLPLPFYVVFGERERQQNKVRCAHVAMTFVNTYSSTREINKLINVRQCLHIFIFKTTNHTIPSLGPRASHGGIFKSIRVHCRQDVHPCPIHKSSDIFIEVVFI